MLTLCSEGCWSVCAYIMYWVLHAISPYPFPFLDTKMGIHLMYQVLRLSHTDDRCALQMCTLLWWFSNSHHYILPPPHTPLTTARHVAKHLLQLHTTTNTPFSWASFPLQGLFVVWTGGMLHGRLQSSYCSVEEMYTSSEGDREGVA